MGSIVKYVNGFKVYISFFCCMNKLVNFEFCDEGIIGIVDEDNSVKEGSVIVFECEFGGEWLIIWSFDWIKCRVNLYDM